MQLTIVPQVRIKISVINPISKRNLPPNIIVSQVSIHGHLNITCYLACSSAYLGYNDYAHNLVVIIMWCVVSAKEVLLLS